MNWQTPIIQSRLQQDYYNFTEGQFAFHRHPNVPVRFALFNRTKDVGLADFVSKSQLEAELDHFRNLPFRDDELQFLAKQRHPSSGRKVFQNDYLDFLRHMKLPGYFLKAVGNGYQFEVEGPWDKTLYWEVPALQIFTQPYTRGAIKKRGLSRFKQDLMFAAGKINLKEKIQMLHDNPDISIVEFGTRRTANFLWHEYVVRTLKAEVRPEQFLGTSNVLFAMKYALKPMGTNSHASQQIYASLYPHTLEGLIDSQRQFYNDWFDEYGPDLATLLPDTFTSDFCFDQVLTKELATKYNTARHDSGSYRAFINKLVKKYQRFGIDFSKKRVFPSDGLDEIDIPAIYGYAKEHALLSGFGWGSNLTNDLGNPEIDIWAPKNISLVIKVIVANGRPSVKLSDNPEKAIGDPEEIEWLKQTIGYKEMRKIQVRY